MKFEFTATIRTGGIDFSMSVTAINLYAALREVDALANKLFKLEYVITGIQLTDPRKPLYQS